MPGFGDTIFLKTQVDVLFEMQPLLKKTLLDKAAQRKAAPPAP